MVKNKNNESYLKAKEAFTNYLKENNYRKTGGRFDILHEIYSNDAHFDVETLYITLKKKNYHISRATIYNTIELLLDCGLIVKHRFGNKAGTYENTFSNKQHDHLICMKTQKVIEFREEAMQEILKKIGDRYNYDISHYSFTLYGTPKK
jgi:Fur family transcriptional regulator, ferric uptake regulator